MKIKPNKALGQNFLNNESILKNIANSIEVSDNDLIIEIGPGTGALTKYLAAKNSYLICYEIDKRMQDALEHFTSNKVKIIYQDFLKADISNDTKDILYNKLYIIANIPYYITKPIIKKVITLPKLDSATLLVQKEVAKRLSAQPSSKAYSGLTVYLNYYFDIDYLFDVDKTCFYPVPKVDSAVVKFTKHHKYQAKNEDVLFKLIEDAFKMKRKTLKNNLSAYDWSKIKPILNNHNLSDLARAEELSIEIFIEVSNILA